MKGGSNMSDNKNNFTKEEEPQKPKEETEMQIILKTREDRKIRKEESGSGKKSFKRNSTLTRGQGSLRSKKADVSISP